MTDRNLLMIPGPIEFEPEVLRAMSIKTASHVAPNFIETFGNCLDMIQKIWQAPTGQAFIVAGSGTLAMDMAAANITEQGDKVLVLSTGYFGKRYKDIFDRYGAKTTIIETPIGETIDLNTIENELKKGIYKIISITHVDTSTGVLTDAKNIAAIANKYNVLSVLDGVCSVAAEEIAQEEWGIDVVLTASQKAIGVPPGLALLVASEKAINVWKNRTTPVQNYYADFANWLPIMKAYQERRPSYFGTPAVNLINALEVSLKQILAEGLQNRFARHKNLATLFRTELKKLGFKYVPTKDKHTANTLSAVYYPTHVNGNDFRKKLAKNNIIVAGGLLPEIKEQYFRVGHMGAVTENDIVAVINAIKKSI
ncbi:MAG: alanine--glyoxylate aminotransferase family protein [Chitinophagales bacterium]|nr:alanine--glyoxylate aminotransferase family protein [Chitinophagales bacterium]